MVHVSQCWTREVSCLVPGPVQQGQGAREPSATSFFRGESSIASLYGDTKLYAGAEGFVGWRADMPGPHSTMFFWDDTEMPGNIVCSTAFLSIVLIGTSSGNVLLFHLTYPKCSQAGVPGLDLSHRNAACGFGMVWCSSATKHWFKSGSPLMAP